MPQEIRVLLVADDPLARAGLDALLTNREPCRVAGQVSSLALPEDALATYRPDVLLWDLGWDPDRVSSGATTSSLERLAALADELPPIVALLPDAAQAAGAWAAGARGLLTREAHGSLIAAALVAAAQGLAIIEPDFMPAAFAAVEPAPGALAEDLTPREHDVLQLLAEGLPNKMIAQTLSISEHTVKFHVNAILGKLGAQSRTEAVVRATRLGLISL